jgi:hypothetical protein
MSSSTPNGCGFRAVLTDAGNGVIRVKVTGTPGSAPSNLGPPSNSTTSPPSGPRPVFDYGVASAGKVQLKNTAATEDPRHARVLRQRPVHLRRQPLHRHRRGPDRRRPGRPDGQDAGVLGGGSVGGGTTSADILASHVKVLTAAPEFPLVDTTVFKKYATNTYAAGASYQKNIRVPANANPSFNAGDIIDGILYIESPNSVTFLRPTRRSTVRSSSRTTNGVAQNVLDFRGNVTPSKIPAGSEFDGLRDLARGLAIAAPTASVTMSGSVDGEIAGSVIAARIDLAGSADLTIRQGSIVALSADPMMVEGKTVNIVGNASPTPPTTPASALRSWFKPMLSTYHEVHQ